MCFLGREESWRTCDVERVGNGVINVLWRYSQERGVLTHKWGLDWGAGKLALRLEKASDMSFIISPWVEMKMWLAYTPKSKAAPAAYFTSQLLSYLLSWQNATVTSSCTHFLSLASGTVYSHSFGLMALTSPSGLPQVGEDPLALCSYGDLCPPTSIIILAPDNGKLSLVFS